MKIRKEQMEVFREGTERALVERIAEYLRSSHTELVQPLDDDVLRRMITNGIARARGHDLTTGYSTSIYVTLMFSAAPNFDENPAVRAALADHDLAPDERILRVLDRLGVDDWRSIEQDYDTHAWHATKDQKP